MPEDRERSLERAEIPEHECCHDRKKHRSEEEYRNLINRLSRVEGQIRGIRGMVEKSAYCPDNLPRSQRPRRLSTPSAGSC